MARRRGATWLSGVLAIDKPEGWTSHDVIAAVRKVAGEGRVGHTGTLDPMATGLMIVLVGPATRLADYIEAQQKSYRATITFGTATDTEDRTGKVIASSEVDADLFSPERAAAIVAGMVGSHSQVPPAYSAIKVDGVRAYAQARKGNDVVLKPRDIEVHSAELVSVSPETNSITVDFTVSKGTYIRSLARDLGLQLGTVAHLSELRRTGIGAVSLADAVSIERLRDQATQQGGVAGLFIEPARPLGLPVVPATDSETMNGLFLDLDPHHGPCDQEVVAAQSGDGRILGVYRCEEGKGQLRPLVVIPGGVLGSHIGRCALTMGVFDGVHLGHQTVLRRCVEMAAERGIPAVAVTFDPAPTPKHFASLDGVVDPAVCPVPERIQRILDTGIDRVVVVPFDGRLSQLTPHDFITLVLQARLTPECFVVGHDFRFGAGGAGGPEELRCFGDTEVVEQQSIGELGPVSSSAIREALLAGSLGLASRYLGRSITVRGRVERGRQIGATLGTPTANLTYSPPTGILRHGVYAGWVRLLGDAGSSDTTQSKHPAAVFVGRPRVDDGKRPLVEVHLIGFEGHLYGQTLEVELAEHIRDVARFENRDDLAAAIRADIARVQERLNSVRS